MKGGIILVTNIHSVSLSLQAFLIRKLLEENGYFVIYGDDYLNQKGRDLSFRPIIVDTLIGDGVKMYATVFLSYASPKILYLSAEGHVNTNIHNASLYNCYDIYTCSHFTKEFLLEADMKVKGVIHHAVDLAECNEALKQPIIFQKPNKKFVWFFYIGGNRKRKRQDIMLEVFREAQKKLDYNIGLQYIADIDDLIQPNDKYIIKMAGFGSLSHLNVMRHLAGADYYLHLTMSEAFGIPALEARALGKPLICLKMPPTIEFIPPKSALWIYNITMNDNDELGLLKLVKFEYDKAEAVDKIIQAYDIFVNYPSEYENMKQECLKDIEKFDYHNAFKVFL